MNGLFLILQLLFTSQPVMLVSEYGSGYVLGFDPASGESVAVPAAFQPVAGVPGGADGMFIDETGRLYVNREDGTVFRSDTTGGIFSLFASLPGAGDGFFLLDLAGNDSHLFATRFATTELYRIGLADASVTLIPGPATANRFDGVRLGPDERIYVVDASDGRIFAWNPADPGWSVFLADGGPIEAASQIEFGADGRVFVSQTVNNQPRIVAYQLFATEDWAGGLDPASMQLIGNYAAASAATGIRIGPDGRLYANAFNAGEVWRSNPGITAMEPAAFVTGLDLPGSILFLGGGGDSLFSDRFQASAGAAPN
ncbi:MAG: hypothetical protein JJU31_16335 [Wenzhouxiangella sp.]|nr:hypothetical protein [Wenzhouxiangella sp.]MCH8477762.1 hypothetical protein [Wenzhouxiangella sp.]TVR94743.1 MAG: hypothetical protein EA418_09485 [Wenzhouxiangellaceae bacterium]